MERKLPEGFKLPVPKLLVPEYVQSMMNIHDVFYNCSESYITDSAQDLGDTIGDNLHNKFMEIASKPFNVKGSSVESCLSNGVYRVTTGGEVYLDDNRDIHYIDDPECCLPTSFMYTVNSDFNRDLGGLNEMYDDLRNMYDEAGGCYGYLSLPKNTRDVRYYWALVDEGKLYIIGYKYNH